MFSFSRSLRRLFATETRLEQRSRLRARTRPRLEALEDRVVPAVVDVTTLSDAASHSGTSLRDAISAANPGDTIQFQAGLSGAINLNTSQGGQGVLTLGKNVTIDGTGASITIEGGSTAGSSSNAEVFLVNSGVNVTLNDLTISNGLATQGGGIFNDGLLTLSYCTLSGNQTSSLTNGGGALANAGTATVEYSTFTNNLTNSSGGAIWDTGGTVAVSDCTFNRNSAYDGGAILANDSSAVVTLTNSTFSQNTASIAGGAVYNGYGTFTVSNCTFSGNAAYSPYSFAGGAGIFWNTYGSVAINNTIIAKSLAGGDLFLGTGTSNTFTGSNDLIDDTSGGTNSSNGYFGAASLYDVAAGLNPNGLQNNGGPTQTIALMAGSPAINAGNNALIPSGIITDQRGPGFARIVNGTVDIGAFEYTPPATVTSITPALTGGTLPTGTTSLQINFNEPVLNANQASNYQLQSVGVDGLLGTADDVIVPVSVSYSGTTATLTFSALPSSVYRLTVKDGITNAVGAKLDGNGDGTPGGNYVRDFVVMNVPNTPLTSPNGFTFDPAMGGFGAGQLVQGTNNVFDGLNRLQVGGVDYSGPAPVIPAVSVQQQTDSGSFPFTNSPTFTAIDGSRLSANVTLSANQTVRLSAVLPLYGYSGNNGYANYPATVGLEFLVDGVAVGTPQDFTMPGGYITDVNLESYVPLSAGTHTITVAWRAVYGYFYLQPGAYDSGNIAVLDAAIVNNVPNAGPAVSVQQQTDSGSFPFTNSGTFTAIDGSRLSTNVSLSANQTVRLSAVLPLYGYSGNNGYANYPATVGLEFLVDGVAVGTPQFFTMSGGYITDVNLESYVPLSAGTHTITVAWRAVNGYFYLQPGAYDSGNIAVLDAAVVNNVPNAGPAVSVQQQTDSGSFPFTNSGTFTAIDGSRLSTNVSLSANQTVRLSAVLPLYGYSGNNGYANYPAIVGLEFLVDGVAVGTPQDFTMPGGWTTDVNLESYVPLSAGTHTITVAWRAVYGYFYLQPGAYDSGNIAVLDAAVVNNVPTPNLVNSGQTLITSTQTLAGLNVSRQITVPNTGSQDFARTIDYFQNPTSSAITTTVSLIGNLGSDAATQVFATSSGDSTPSVNDEWFGTDGGPGTTALIHILHGPAGLKPTSVSVSGDNIEWTYTITVQPGQTLELGTFTIQASSETNAVAEANALVTPTGFGGQAAAFLSASDLASLANFSFTLPPVANAGGPYAIQYGNDLALNGTGSSDPNAGGLIVSYAWDLQNNGQYADASGATPTIPWTQLQALGLGVGTHTIGLKVADSYGLTSTTTTTLNITQATPTITFGGSGYDSTSNSYSFTYNSAAQSASASVIGVGGVNLGSASLSYYQGSYASLAALQQAIKGGTAVQLSGAPGNAGDYTVLASYSGSTSYTSAQAIAAITIAKATPTVSVSDGGGTYNGLGYAATDASVTGVGSDGTLASFGSSTLSYSYYRVNPDNSLTSLGSSAPADAGNYEVIAHYTSANSNYTNADSAPVTFIIGQRSITVTAAANSKIYDGTTSASDTPTLTSGSLASGDTGTFTETYDNRNVGTTHVLTPTGTIQNSSHVDVTADYSITFATINTGGITAKALTYSGLSAPTSKVYDGTTTAAASGTAVLQTAETAGSGSSSDGTPYSVDSVSLTGTPTGTYNSKDVATANTVTFGGLSLTGAGAGNYTLTASTEAATITPKTLTVSGLSANNKTYDATATDPLSGTAALTFETAGTGSTSDGEAYTSDSVSLSGTTVGTFAGKDVGTAIAVTVSGNTLGGTQAGDYVLATNEESGLSANITPKTLFVSGLSAGNKIYDATTAATLSGTAALLSSDTAGASTADGHPYSGDTVSLSSTAASGFTGTFTSKDVANGIIVDVTGNSLTGAQAGDYVLSSIDEANGAVTANITPKALTYSGLSVPTSKVYDGTTTAAVSGTAVLQTAETAGSGDTSDDKPYTGDSVSLTGTPTGTYNSKDVAAANTVTFGGLSLAGANSGDYTLTNSTQAATITQKTLAVSGISAADKVYDGTTTASLSGTGSLVGVVSGDTVTLDQTGQSGIFASKDVANGITVTVSGLALGGGQAGDYQLGTPQYTTTASITPKTLTASIIGDPSKTYDGAATATLTSSNYSLSGLVGTESFTVTQTAGTYNSAHVLAANTVTSTLNASDFTAGSGTLASDYSLPTTASGAGQITARSATASIIGDPSKTYDGNSSASLTASNFQLSNLVSGESFTVTQTLGTYNSAHVASANTVTASLSAGDFTAGSGTLASDYDLPTSASGAGQITARTISASIVGDPSKSYDGSTSATLTTSNFSLSNLVSGESFTVTQTTGAYNSAHVLAANTVTATLDASDFTAGSGTLASDYSLPTSASGAGQITTRTVTASIVGDPTKIYDGNTGATLNSSNFQLSNLVSGESFTVTQTAGTYNSAHVLAANTVTAALDNSDFTAGSGTLASDYNLPTSASGAGQITARTVSASIIGDPSKTYDGSTSATLNSSNFQLSNLVGGESFTVTQTVGNYNSAHVASANTVTASLSADDFTAGSGTLASDYSLPISASGVGQITPRTVTASIFGDPTKIYDGSTSATLTASNFSLSNLVSGESFTVTQTAGTYNSTHVASANTVTASLSAGDFTAGSGTMASDYTLPTSASGAGQITARTVSASIIGDPSKVYDGNTGATLNSSNFQLSNLISGESFTVTKTAGTYNSAHVASASTVTAALSAADFTAGSGTLASDYSLPTSASGAGQITARTISASIIGDPSKSYDGSTSATLTTSNFSLSNLVSGESFTVTQTTGTYNSAHVLAANTVTSTLNASDFTAGSGTLASDYTLPTSASGAGQITPYTFTYQIGNDSQTYGSAANLAKDLGTTIATGVNGENLAIAYASTGDTATTVVGTYTITGTLSNGTGLTSDYSVTLKNGTLTVNPAPLIVTANPQTVQYSDSVTFTSMITGFVNGQSASVVSGNPNYTTTASLDTSGGASGSNGAVLSGPGTYTITPTLGTLSAANYSFTFKPGTLTVTPENATATYTGDLFVFAPSITSNSATVILRATIQDPATSIGDPSQGDIRNATVTFVDRGNNNAILGTANLPVTLIKSSDTTTGSAVESVTLPIGSSGSTQYTIGVIVGNSGSGYYADNSSLENTVVTVSQPLSTGFITGGGYLVASTSAGSYAADPGSKVNFGFNVKFNKSGTSLQGGFNALVRQSGHEYQIKSNSMSSLGISGTNQNLAQFDAKANVTDITNPNNPISLGGNYSLHVTMTDNGSPTTDTIGITLWSGTTLLFSSNWNGATTVEQNLGGGNLAVHHAQLVAGGAFNGPGSTQVLTEQMLQPIVTEALAEWQAAGVSPDVLATLRNTPVEITDLPGAYLGRESANGVILIDTNAAGYGWYVGGAGTSPAAGRVDLLTVVAHELGHVLGITELNDPSDVMFEDLGLGVRKVPDAADVVAAGLLPAVNAPVAGSSAASGQSMTASSSMSVPLGGLTPLAQSSKPLSAVDQLFTELALLMSDARIAYQSELSSVMTLWQSSGVLALQRLDDLLSH